MKKQVVIIASLLAASHGAAFASSNDTAAAPFSSVEAQQLFEQDAQPMQVAALSNAEMKQTEGAFWNYLGLGAVGGYLGGLGYATSVPAAERTTQGWAMAIGSGAVGGAIGGIPWGAVRMGFYGNTIGFMGNSMATSSWGRR